MGFNGTTMLRKLDISYNKMKHPKSGWFIPLTNLTTLNVGHNPWSCDCHSLDFKNYLMTLPQDSSNILYHQFQCNTTQGLMNFEDVDASYYTCGGQPGPTIPPTTIPVTTVLPTTVLPTTVQPTTTVKPATTGNPTTADPNTVN